MKQLQYLILMGFVLHVLGCSQGQFATTGNPDPDKGSCTACLPTCKTCTTLLSCETGLDSLMGLNRAVSPHTPLCSFAGANWLSGPYGYNPTLDVCDRCKEGCASCAIDYNVCTTCKAGWDIDANANTCQRVVLGLTAASLGFLVILFIFNILTCVIAFKL